jgi:hypothetical protein
MKNYTIIVTDTDDDVYTQSVENDKQKAIDIAKLVFNVKNDIRNIEIVDDEQNTIALFF